MVMIIDSKNRVCEEYDNPAQYGVVYVKSFVNKGIYLIKTSPLKRNRKTCSITTNFPMLFVHFPDCLKKI